MKKYVWSETRIEGGQSFNGKLKQPEETTGYFQNVEAAGDAFSPHVGEVQTYYSDAQVVAYKLPAADRLLSDLNPTVRSSGGSFSLAQLTDGDLNTTTYLPPQQVGEEMWIEYSFTEPQSFKAVSVTGANHTPLEQFQGGPENRRLLVSDDGTNFQEVARLPGSIAPQNTVAFSHTSGKVWRLVYETLPPPFNPFLAMVGAGGPDPEPEGVHVAEFVLHSSDRIDRFEDKAGVTPWREDTPTYRAGNADAIAQATLSI